MSLAPVETWAEGFTHFRGVAVDPNGLVHVADGRGGTVIRIETDPSKTVLTSQLDRPTGLACDFDGRQLRGLL